MIRLASAYSIEEVEFYQYFYGIQQVSEVVQRQGTPATMSDGFSERVNKPKGTAERRK